MSRVLFALTLFLSAALLFLVQPMVGKLMLPLLGGTPAVWNTCLVFFQALLLAGYAYSHVLTDRLGVRRQLAVQRRRGDGDADDHADERPPGAGADGRDDPAADPARHGEPAGEHPGGAAGRHLRRPGRPDATPNASFTGKATLTYAAWDRTKGAVGDIVDTQDPLLADAFSLGTNVAYLPVNTAPTLKG